jgi:hypothetical protein
MEPLTEYYRQLMLELRESSEAASLPLMDVAFERLCSTLEAEGELEMADQGGWRGSSGGKTLRIDGYGGDPRETDGVLCIIACELFDTDEPATLNASDSKKIFGHLANFVAACRKSDFRDSLALGTREFGIATMVAESWSSVTKVKLLLVTNGNYSARTDANIAGQIGDIPVTYSIWDLTRLHRVETTGGKEKIVVDFERDFGGAIPALEASVSESAFPSFLAIIRGKQLADIYEKWGARLLEANIRLFIQARRKSVNEGIRDTIRESPRMFFSYNNGLSATADSLETQTDDSGIKILSARNLQIVNGGQTTASLHAALRQYAHNLEQVHVQLKLTVVPTEHSGDVVPKISNYANIQNKASAADFFSNQPLHLRIEGYSRRVLAPAPQGGSRQTRWYYERMRGQYLVDRMKLGSSDRRRFDAEHPKAQLFLKTDLAKVELSFNQRPEVVSKGAQKTFSAFAAELGAAWSANETRYDETWFKRLIAKLVIFRTLEKAVPRQTWYPGGYRANIVTYGIAKLAFDNEAIGKTLDLDRVWEQQAVPEGMLNCLLLSCEAAAAAILSPQSGVKNVTEWAKKQACWGGLSRSKVEYGPDLLNHVIDPDAARAVQRDGQRDAAMVSGIVAQTRVVELGGAFWSRLRVWATPNRAFTAKDDGILKACSQTESRLPSERQCVLAIAVLERARQEGYVDDEETPRIKLAAPRSR